MNAIIWTYLGLTLLFILGMFIGYTGTRDSVYRQGYMDGVSDHKKELIKAGEALRKKIEEQYSAQWGDDNAAQA